MCRYGAFCSNASGSDFFHSNQTIFRNAGESYKKRHAFQIYYNRIANNVNRKANTSWKNWKILEADFHRSGPMVRIFGNLEIQLSNIWKSLVIFCSFSVLLRSFSFHRRGYWQTPGNLYYIMVCGHGGIGRLGGFRFHCQKRAGSSPVARTIMGLWNNPKRESQALSQNGKGLLFLTHQGCG